jgi:hypothetical protein
MLMSMKVVGVSFFLGWSDSATETKIVSHSPDQHFTFLFEGINKHHHWGKCSLNEISQESQPV